MSSSTPHAPEPKRPPWGIIIVAGLLVLGLVLVPLLEKAFDDSPKEWLDDHYRHVAGSDPGDEAVVYESDEDAATTARDVDRGTDADELRQTDTAYFLRYDSDWMVAVIPSSPGARIELYEFDDGYQHFGPSVFFWNSHYGRGSGGGFRGGGSGSGK